MSSGGGSGKIINKYVRVINILGKHVDIPLVLCVFHNMGCNLGLYPAGSNIKQALFYCRNVVFLVHPGWPRGGSERYLREAVLGRPKVTKALFLLCIYRRGPGNAYKTCRF